jgi:hypothetical protein
MWAYAEARCRRLTNRHNCVETSSVRGAVLVKGIVAEILTEDAKVELVSHRYSMFCEFLNQFLILIVFLLLESTLHNRNSTPMLIHFVSDYSILR